MSLHDRGDAVAGERERSVVDMFGAHAPRGVDRVLVVRDAQLVCDGWVRDDQKLVCTGECLVERRRVAIVSASDLDARVFDILCRTSWVVQGYDDVGSWWERLVSWLRKQTICAEGAHIPGTTLRRYLNTCEPMPPVVPVKTYFVILVQACLGVQTADVRGGECVFSVAKYGPHYHGMCADIYYTKNTIPFLLILSDVPYCARGLGLLIIPWYTSTSNLRQYLRLRLVVPLPKRLLGHSGLHHRSRPR